MAASNSTTLSCVSGSSSAMSSQKYQISSGFGSSSAAIRDVHCWAASVADISPSMKDFITAISAVVGKSPSSSASTSDLNHSSYIAIVGRSAKGLYASGELFVVLSCDDYFGAE